MEEKTMNDIQVFNNNRFGEIRMVYIDSKPYFVGIDVARGLGYSNTRDAILRHCKGVVKHDVPHPQSPQSTIEMNVIPQGDVYRLAANSELPGAEEFESWIFDEVLPSIHKHGAYMTPATIEEALRDPDTIIQLATTLKEERAKSRLLTQEKDVLETALNTSLKFYTVAKYNKMYKMGWDLAECQKIGKELTAFCRANSIKIEKCETNDERFGTTNSYPLTAWESFLYSYTG